MRLDLTLSYKCILLVKHEAIFYYFIFNYSSVVAGMDVASTDVSSNPSNEPNHLLKRNIMIKSYHGHRALLILFWPATPFKLKILRQIRIGVF